MAFEHNPSVPNPLITVLPSAARTANTSSATFTQSGYRGIRIWLTVTVASGTGGLKVFLRQKNPIDGNMYEVNAGGALVTTAVTRVYDIAPSVGAASGFIQESLGRQLGQTWDVLVTHGDATSYTYSVAVEMLP
jgi:hypothetical protein